MASLLGSETARIGVKDGKMPNGAVLPWQPKPQNLEGTWDAETGHCTAMVGDQAEDRPRSWFVQQCDLPDYWICMYKIKYANESSDEEEDTNDEGYLEENVRNTESTKVLGV